MQTRLDLPFDKVTKSICNLGALIQSTPQIYDCTSP